MNEVSVQRIRPINTPGNLKAYADIVINGIVIKDCRIVQQPDQSPWVAMSQKSWKNRDGVTTYAAIVLLPEGLKTAVQQSILEAWESAA